MNKKPDPAPTDRIEPAQTAAEEVPPVRLEPSAQSAPVVEGDQLAPAAAQVAGEEGNALAHAGGEAATGTRWGWVKPVERFFALLANLAVIGGVWFAVNQLRQADVLEQRRVAIEAVGQTRTPEFLSAYRRLKDAHASQQVKAEDREKLVDSLNQVMSVYDQIAILYVHNVADKCIIKAGIHRGASEMAPIASSFTYPDKYWDNFNSLLLLMERENCG